MVTLNEYMDLITQQALLIFGIIKFVCVFHSTNLPRPSTSNFVFAILQTIMVLGLTLKELHILLLSILMKIYADDAEILH